MEIKATYTAPDKYAKSGYREATATGKVYQTTDGDFVLMAGAAHELGRFATLEEATAAAPALLIADKKGSEAGFSAYAAWEDEAIAADARTQARIYDED